MTEETELDVRLHWQDREAALRNTNKDSVAVGEEARGSDSQIQDVTQGTYAGGDVVGDEEHDEAYLEDQDDEFQWTEERERELEEALDESPEGSVPRVQLQLEAILTGLETESLEVERAPGLLDEIDRYLALRIETEQSKSPIEHADFTQSRKEKLNALFAFQEAVVALRQYLQEGQAMQLKVAAYATEQGGSFLQVARELLMKSEPDYEDFEEFGADDNFDSEEEYEGEEFEDEDFEEE